MTIGILIESPSKINEILDQIHDCWFDKESITLDCKTSIMTIPFKRDAPFEKRIELWRFLFFKKIKIPIFECHLKIFNVQSYKIYDEANIGTYDFNDLGFDARDKKVRITGGVPIRLDIEVQTFKIAIEETNKVVGARQKLVLFCCKPEP